MAPGALMGVELTRTWLNPYDMVLHSGHRREPAEPFKAIPSLTNRARSDKRGDRIEARYAENHQPRAPCNRCPNALLIS
jgi:hypothetical protein